jgi:hypothetical protein
MGKSAIFQGGVQGVVGFSHQLKKKIYIHPGLF